MIRIINESGNIDYEWLLNYPMIKENYIRLYLENYIYSKLDIISYNDWYRNSDNQLSLDFDIDEDEYKSLINKLMNSFDYKNKEKIYFYSTKSDIDHFIKIYKNKMIVSTVESSINDIISDYELISMYEDDNDILNTLLSSKFAKI